MNYYAYGRADARFLLIQPEGEHHAESEKKEAELIREFSDAADYRLIVVPVNSWDEDLSPWDAPPVFGKVPFGHGAKETLRRIEEELLPELLQKHREAFVNEKGASEEYQPPFVVLGGYSLAGLFAFYAAFESESFDAVSACSPSVWFPGFLDYVKVHEIHTRNVYLSLGDREEKAKNRVFAAVGGCIRECDRILKEHGVNSVLAWNSGNHFVDGEMRTAKGFAWTIRELMKEER